MLKKGIGRVKPWQRGVTGPKAKKVHQPTPKPDVPHHLYNDMSSYPPSYMQLPYGYPAAQHAYYPPHPPPHHQHQREHPHHEHTHHKKENFHSGKHNGPHEHHHGSPHPPPPPPPGVVKRFFQYIFDTLKKRPIASAFVLTNVAFFAHRKLNPEMAEKQLNEAVDVLRKASTSWDSNTRSGKDIIKVTKLTDSLNNYSKSFKKASLGTSVSSAIEHLQSASILKHMKTLESSLSEEKKQEITRLTDAFQRDNEKVTASLENVASQLRHCQLSGLASGLNSDSMMEGDSTSREEARAADAAAREQSNTALQHKFVELTTKKFAMETDFIQLVCEVLDGSQRKLLCNDLLKNNASSIAQVLKTPMLYPEINGLSCTKRAVYVLKFDGNITASGVSTLRHEVTAIVENADKKRGDRVVIVLNSGGGTVGGYGLGASQLERIKAAGLHLTVCVDEVAASGGYLMACVADTVVCAPFATLGSIGVMTMVPNFHERLKREGIQVDTITAGNYKRTLTPTSKPTPENRKKMQEDLNSIHETFKTHIQKYRPEVNMKTVATGETWLGSDALKLGLCDSLSTSDDYLLQLSKDDGTEVYRVKYNTSRQRSVLQSLLQGDEDADVAELSSGVGSTSTSTYIASILAQIITKTIGHVVLQDTGAAQISSSSSSTSSTSSSERDNNK